MGRTPLIYACEFGEMDIALLLQKKGADMRHQDKVIVVATIVRTVGDESNINCIVFYGSYFCTKNSVGTMLCTLLCCAL